MATPQTIQRVVNGREEMPLQARMNIGDDAINNIALKTNLKGQEPALKQLVYNLSIRYVSDKLYEIFWKKACAAQG